jgi:hypothetical protein
MIAESTYWARLGTVVLAPRYAIRIQWQQPTLKIAFGANTIDLTEFIRSVRACNSHLLEVDTASKLSGKAVKGMFYSWVQTSVINHQGDYYASYPIKDDCFVFGSTYVYLPRMIQLVIEDAGESLYHLDRYWY